MKRRELLVLSGMAATTGSIGIAKAGARLSDEDLEIKIWTSERASGYDGLVARITTYLDYAFSRTHASVTVEYGGSVAVDHEDAYEALVSGEWPVTVLRGDVGVGDVSPAEDINFLVTDGDVRLTPTGAGVPRIAAVGGAGVLAGLPPIDLAERVTDRLSLDPGLAVLPDSRPARVMQLVLHECGHAVGLRHNHGTIYRTPGALVVSPMVSMYAWSKGRFGSDTLTTKRTPVGSPTRTVTRPKESSSS